MTLLENILLEISIVAVYSLGYIHAKSKYYNFNSFDIGPGHVIPQGFQTSKKHRINRFKKISPDEKSFEKDG